jgi:16S rRNA (cytidine1402-2'-O)-methyltransferase
MALAPGLYVVATPIGNLADISLRALEVLAKADLVACEDTRTTRKLLTAHGISAKLTAYHDHNAARVRPKLIERLECGEAVALVSDAGTPLISDPGYKLVAAAAEAKVTVMAVPGASAALAALTVAGLPSDRFLFAGFLPNKSGARRRALAELAPTPASLVIYESARRLPASLVDMAAVLGPRPAAVARELTKLHEEVRRGRLPELAEHYEAAGPPKGEVVVVIGPPEPNEADTPDAEALDSQLRAALSHDSLRDAVAAVAEATGLPRKQIYARALELAQEAGPGGRNDP